MVTAIRKLINKANGTMDRSLYADKNIYQQELEQVFGRCWLFVGHETQIAKPNDFVAEGCGEGKRKA